MPTYEYECKECQRRFETVMTVHEHEEKHRPACPKCGSRKVEPRPSAVQVVTSSKA